MTDALGFLWLWLVVVAVAGVLLLSPAVAAVAHLDRTRLVPPLSRGRLERACVLAAAGAASAICAAGLWRNGAQQLLLVGGSGLGAIPWVAGETLSGWSVRSIPALAAAAWFGAAVAWAGAIGFELDTDLSLAPCVLVCAAAAAGASFLYLAVRGGRRCS